MGSDGVIRWDLQDFSDLPRFRLFPRSSLLGQETSTKVDTGTLLRQTPLALRGVDETILLKLDLPVHRLLEIDLDGRIFNLIGLDLILLGCDDLREQRT